jgi:hypothetical protein
LAHWSCAYSPELSNVLLISRPENKMILHFSAIHIGRTAPPDVPFDPDNIFVVTENWLGRLADQMREAKNHVTQCMASVWVENRPEQRAEWLQKLSNEPAIRGALTRIAESRQN